MKPWTIPVDSHPIGRPSLLYPTLWEFRSLGVIASRHSPRHSRCLRVPAAPSPQANGKAKHLRKQHQHYTRSLDCAATVAYTASS